MNHQSENVSPRQLKAGRNWLWLALLCFGVPIVLSAAVLLYYISRERDAEAQLAERLERRFQAGLPYDNASASEYHAQHTSAELTDRWLEVLAILESEQFKQSTADVASFDTKVESSVPRSKDAPWPEGRVTRRFLNRWQGLQQRVQRLSRLQLEPDAAPVWMPIEFNSIETLLPHAQSLRQAARLLSLSGQVAALEHDSAAVRRNVESLLGAARTLRGEPIVVSQLVTVAINGHAIDLLRLALEQDVLSEADLRALLPQILAGSQVAPNWRWGIEGEIGMMLPLFQNPTQTSDERIAQITQSPGSPRDALHYLDHMEQVAAVSQDDDPDYANERTWTWRLPIRSWRE